MRLPESPGALRLLRIVMWIVTVVAGLLQGLACRFYISGDGNSYLDIASAYLRGDFANAINGYWSPLYSWLIAAILGLFKPSGYWETTILHLLNFATLGLVLGLGYLAKSFYFPMAFVFIATAWLASRAPRENLKRALAALVVFLLLASPFVFALSKTKHRLTYGDVGKISYAQVTAWLSQPMFWVGENGSGTPKHPVHIILAS